MSDIDISDQMTPQSRIACHIRTGDQVTHIHLPARLNTAHEQAVGRKGGILPAMLDQHTGQISN